MISRAAADREAFKARYIQCPTASCGPGAVITDQNRDFTMQQLMVASDARDCCDGATSIVTNPEPPSKQDVFFFQGTVPKWPNGVQLPDARSELKRDKKENQRPACGPQSEKRHVKRKEKKKKVHLSAAATSAVCLRCEGHNLECLTKGIRCRGLLARHRSSLRQCGVAAFPRPARWASPNHRKGRISRYHQATATSNPRASVGWLPSPQQTAPWCWASDEADDLELIRGFYCSGASGFPQSAQ